MTWNLAAAMVILMAGAASAQTKYGRTGERGKSSNAAPVFGSQSSVHAVPAAAPSRAAAPSSVASPKNLAAPQQNRGAAASGGAPKAFYGGTVRRADDGGQAPSGPTPQAGALIRTAGAGSRLEADNSHRWHAIEAGYPQPGGLALTNHQGVSRFKPDLLPGQSGSGSGTGVSSHQSWLEGLGGNNSGGGNSNGPNINVNNGNTNGNGNGRSR